MVDYEKIQNKVQESSFKWKSSMILLVVIVQGNANFWSALRTVGYDKLLPGHTIV